MTKAEAFEYLKAKKVSVSDAEMNDRVQSKLFACGVQWKNGGTNVCYYSDYLVITPHGLLCHCDGLGEDYWNRLFHEEISADDILSIEIVEGTPEFSYDKVVELAKPLMHYLSENGHTEVISVCKEGISAIPMGTFLYKGQVMKKFDPQIYPRKLYIVESYDEIMELFTNRDKDATSPPDTDGYGAITFPAIEKSTGHCGVAVYFVEDITIGRIAHEADHVVSSMW